MFVRMQATNSYDGRAWLNMDCRESEPALARMLCHFTSTGIAMPAADSIAAAAAAARAGALQITPAALAAFHRRCPAQIAEEETHLANLPAAALPIARRDLAELREMCATTTIAEFAEASAAAASAQKAQCQIYTSSFEIDLRRVGVNSWVTAEPRPDHCGLITAVTLQRGDGRYDDVWTYTQTRSAGGSTDGLCGVLIPGDVQIYSTKDIRAVALTCAELY